MQSRTDEKGRLHSEGLLVCAVHGVVFSSPGEEPARHVMDGYRSRGVEFLKELDGEFSLVIWDGRTRTLVAVRDCFGLKPLYFTESPDILLLGTECRDIRGSEVREEDLDADTLLRGISSVDVAFAPTVYKGIKRLQPARATFFSCEGGPVSAAELWSPVIAGLDESAGWGFERPETSETLRFHLRTAVRKRMGSGNVGLTLSGGHDSNAILAAAVQEGMGSRVHAVTMAFPGMRCDETGVAREVAKGSSIASWAEIDGLECGSIDLARATALMCDRPATGTLTQAVLWARHFSALNVRRCFLGVGGDETLEDGAYGVEAALFGHRLTEFGALWAQSPVDALRVLGFVARRAALPFMTYVGATTFQRREAQERQALWPSLGTDRVSVNGFLATRRLALLTWTILRCVYESLEQVFSRFGMDVSFPLLDRRLVEFVFSLPGSAVTGYRDRKHLLREAIGPWLDVSKLSPKGTITFGEPMKPMLSLAPVAARRLREGMTAPQFRWDGPNGLSLRTPGLPAVWTYLWLQARGVLPGVERGQDRHVSAELGR